NRATQQDVDATNSDWAYAVGGTSVCSTAVKPHQLRQVTATGPKAGTATRDFCYDPAGNITKRTTETGAVQDLTWDIEGHLQRVDQACSTVASYVYDSSGNRLIGTHTSGSTTTSTLYLSDGTELAKVNGAN